VYYQNVLTEPIIVYASISIHVLSSLLKKALQAYSRFEARRKDASSVKGYTIGDEVEDSDKVVNSARSALPPITLQTITGALMIPALSVHAYLNRIAPSSSSAPIKELSPSELDYTYVTHGFLTSSKAWRYITWTVYAVLLTAGAAHVVNGTDKIARRSKARKDMKRVKKAAATSPPASALGTTRADIQQVDVKRRYRRKALINGTVSFLGAAWLAAGIRRMVLEDNGTTLWLTKRVSSA
jgi:succinate dehydrogenase hydrophobic anchor subunit